MAKDPIQTLDRIVSQLESRVMDVVNKHSKKLWRITVSEHMAGPTGSSSVEKRTGKLARSVRAIPAYTQGGRVIGGEMIGEKYGRVHIGPRGSTFIIRPKNRQFLTIPLDAAKTGAGVARAGATSSIWGPTFIAKGIIFGYSGGTKGTASKSPIPLFVLKRQVVVPRRIDPNLDLLAKVKPDFIADLKKVVSPGG